MGVGLPPCSLPSTTNYLSNFKNEFSLAFSNRPGKVRHHQDHLARVLAGLERPGECLGGVGRQHHQGDRGDPEVAQGRGVQDGPEHGRVDRVLQGGVPSTRCRRPRSQHADQGVVPALGVPRVDAQTPRRLDRDPGEPDQQVDGK